MKVADPSTMLHPSFPEGVNILFFAPRQEALPHPDCAGHLIRLHRCKVCPSLMQLKPGCCSHIANAHFQAHMVMTAFAGLCLACKSEACLGH